MSVILDQMEPVFVDIDTEGMTDEEIELLMSDIVLEAFVKIPEIAPDHVITKAVETLLRQVDKDVDCL